MSKAKEKRGSTIAKDLKAAEQLVPQLQEAGSSRFCIFWVLSATDKSKATM